MGVLTGQRIVVTRAEHQSEELAAPLRDLGGEIILLPTIGIAPPLDPAPLRAAAQHCNHYHWIVFTSTNAVQAFVAELAQDAASCQAQIATIGAATREAAERHGFHVSLTPEKYVAESLVEAFRSEDLRGRRILLPSAAITRDVVAARLRQLGADVAVVQAYRNIVPSETARQVSAIFREPYPDWATFTSSSAIDNLVPLTGVEPLRKVKIATIGPITSESVRKQGLTVAAEAAVHSVAGLVRVLNESAAGRELSPTGPRPD